MKPYYEDADVVLYHGDCREADAWLSADVLVTDPPYGMHHSPHGTNDVSISGELRTGRASMRVLGDLHVAARDAALAAWGDRPALVFGNWRAPKPVGTQMRLIWDKGRVGMGGVDHWRSSDEEIYVVNWPNSRNAGGSHGSVIRGLSLRGNQRPDHPTPKPVGLMEQLVAWSPPGVVADPFAGSGSTLLAARAQGRRAIGVELEERYCEVIARRLAQGDLFGGVA